MRILIITPSFPPDHTGAGNIMLGTAIRIRKQFGVKSRVLRIHYKKGKLHPYEINNVHVSYLNTIFPMQGVYTGLFLFEAVFKLNSFFRKYRHEIDLVHCLTVTWFTLFALLIAKIYKIPSLLESTLFGDVIPEQKNLPKLIYKIKEVLKKPLFKSATAYKVYSPLLENEFASIGINNGVYCIPAPIDVKHFKPATTFEKTSFRKRLNLFENGTYFLFVGGICKRKGVKLLVEAFATLASSYKNIYLLLVGPTAGYDQSYIKEINEIITTNCLKSRVFFTDRKVDNVADFMKASDIFILPSMREGFGVVTVEAMATGLPTIVTNIDGISGYQIEDGNDGYIVYERTVADLKEKMIMALKDAGSPNAKLKHKAREKACSMFSSKIVDKQLYELYKKLQP